MLRVVELVAGLGYLLQKVLLYYAESNQAPSGEDTDLGRKLRIAGWVSYLIGLPMWLAIFVINKNWILVFIEGGGLPSMILGLVIAITRRKPTKTGGLSILDKIAFTSAVVGVIVSVYSFGGLEQTSQWLEVGVTAGFLVGTYLIANRRPAGWLWYVLMNVSAGSLMFLQGYLFLTAQQATSLTFVLLAYKKAKAPPKN